MSEIPSVTNAVQALIDRDRQQLRRIYLDAIDKFMCQALILYLDTYAAQKGTLDNGRESERKPT